MADDIIKILSEEHISQTSRVNALFMAAHSCLDAAHKLSMICALAANLVNKAEVDPEIRKFLKQIE
jgi:hypothetical protein